MANRPDTIALRIAIEGAEDVLRRLKELGSEGEKAFKQMSEAVSATQGSFGTFGRLVEDATNNIKAGFERATDIASKFAGFKLGNVKQEFENFNAALSNTIAQFTKLGAAIAGVAVATVALLRQSIHNVAEIGKEAQVLGLTTDAYQDLQFMAAASGVEQDRFAVGVRNLSKAVNELAQARQKAQFAFDQQFGIVSVSQLEQFGLVGSLADQVRTKLDAMGLRVVGVGEQFEQLRARMVKSGVRFVQTELNVAGLSEGLGDAAKALNSMGIKVFDAQGKLRTLDDMLPDIAEGFKKLGTGPEAVAKAIAIFGRSGNDLLPLLTKGKKGLDELRAAFRALGITLTEEDIRNAEAANVAWTTFTFTLSRVKDQLAIVFAPAFQGIIEGVTQAVVRNYGSWKNLATVISQSVKPVVGDIIGLLEGKQAKTEFVQKWVAAFKFLRDGVVSVFGVLKTIFAEFVSGLQFVSRKINEFFGIKVDATTLGVILVLGVITGAFTTIAAAVTLAISAFVAFFALFKGLGALLFLVGRGIALALGGLVGLVAAITGLPVAAVVAIALGLIALTVLFVKYGDKIKAGWNAVWSYIADRAKGVWASIADIWKSIADGAGKAWASIRSGASLLWAFLAGGFVGLIGAGLASAWNALKQQASAAWASVKQSASDALTSLRDWFNIGGLLSAAWEAIKTAAAAAWKAVTDAASAAWDGVKAIWGASVGAFFSALWEDLKTAAAALWKSIGDAAKGAVDAIKEAFGGIGQFFVGVWDSIKGAAEAAWNEIKESASTLWASIKTSWESGSGTLDTIWNKIKSSSTSAWNFVLEGAAGIVSKIAGALEPIARAVTAPLSRLVDGVVEAFNNMVAGAKQLAEAIVRVTTVGFDISKLTEVAAALFRTFMEADTKIRGTINGLIQFFSEIGNRLTTAISGAFKGVDTTIAGVGATITKAVEDIIAKTNLAIAAANRAVEAARQAAAAAASGTGSAEKTGQPVTAATVDVGVLQTVAAALLNPFLEADRKIRELLSGLQEFIGAFGRGLAGAFEAGIAGLQALANQIVAPFRDADQQIRQLWSQLPAFIASQAQLIGEAIRQALAAAMGAVAAVGAGGGAAADGARGAGGEGPAAAPAGGGGLSGIFEALVAPFRQAAAVIPTFLQAIQAAVNSFGQSLLAGVTPAFEQLVSAMNTAATAAESAAQRIADAAAKAVAAAKQLGDAAGGLPFAGGGQAGGRAGGGHIVGWGTETSDSIRALLSHNEFVTQAAQVRRLGVGFMHFINQRGVTLVDVFHRLHERFGRGFNLGGVAERIAMPRLAFDFATPFALTRTPAMAFAGGGAAVRGPHHTLEFVLPGGTKVGPFQAASSVVADLERAATIRRIKSAGRAPSSVK